MATYTPDDLLLVRVGSVNFAFPAREHQGVLPRDDIGPSDASLEHEGQRVTWVNLRARLGLPAEGYAGQVVLGTVEGQRIGLVVDEVMGRLKRSQTSQLPLPGELPPDCFSEAFLVYGQITLRTTLAILVRMETSASLHQLATALPTDAAPAEKRSGSVTSHVPLDQTLARAAAELARPQRPHPAPAEELEGPKTAPPQDAYPKQPHAAAQAVDQPSDRLAQRDSGQRTLFTGAQGAEQEPGYSSAFAWPSNMGDIKRALGLTSLGLAGVAALVVGLQGWRNHQPERTRTAEAQSTGLPASASSGQQQKARASKEPSQAPAPDGKSGQERSAKIAGEIIHTVVKGDTLWAIANRYINNPWAYHELANHSGISDPDIIRPGDQVRITVRKTASKPAER